MFKTLINALVLVLMFFLLLYYDLVIYGISQGAGQASIVLGAKPIEEVINNKDCADSVRQKLILITEIKKFAIDSLGINPSDNYSTFFDQTGKPRLFTVSACEPYGFKAKEWTFPFLGRVSYKGFFDQKKAKKEIAELRSNNYDVDVYSPSGWSTLGWFKDPVLSNMLKRNPGELANLIIHELTHGTLYVKNDVTFNENLANFIGDKGAEKFLIKKYGPNSKEYKEYFNAKEDEKTYNTYILAGKEKLSKLYSSFSSTDTDEIKKSKKMECIRAIVSGVYNLELHKKQNYFNYTLQAFYEGNAFFMAFDRYDSQQDLFEKEYKDQYDSNLKTYLEALKRKFPSL